MLMSDSAEENRKKAEHPDTEVESFRATLLKNGIRLEREKTVTLQINTGLLCNQRCRHCHLSAGPGESAVMNKGTVEDVLAYAQKCRFEVIDITGGAPELNPYIRDLVKGASRLAPRVMFRSNLSALNDGRRDDLMHMLAENKVVVVASFPSLNVSQTDAQRGEGIFEISVAGLKKLNGLGYGMPGTGLELNLVSNPPGAFLPPAQDQTEKRFHKQMAGKWGVHFNKLFNFANVPLGRFREWLIESGNFAGYIQKLAAAFNPCAVPGVMCRSMMSVSWDGYLFDCDFNLARRLHMGGKKRHVTQMAGAPEAGNPIATADHCYTCTAGSGFT